MQKGNYSRAWYKNAEMLVAISAIFLSVITVAVGVYSAYVDREYSRASVWPSLQIGRSFNISQNQKTYKYVVLNNGTGPAIIKSVELSYKNNYYKTWQELFNEFGIEKSNFSQAHISTTVVPTNKQINALVTDNPLLVDSLLMPDKGFHVAICYCSIFDECWRVSGDSQRQEVDQCIIDPQKTFIQ
jgi:hypothetical protein